MFTAQFPLILRRGVLAIMMISDTIAMTFTTTHCQAATHLPRVNCERLISLMSDFKLQAEFQSRMGHAAP
jgi:hypothetical protein